MLHRLEDALGPAFENIVRFKPGGMGLLYRAHDVLLDRKVVIKVVQLPVDPRSQDYQDAVRRLKREAQMAAGLSHPGIVPIYFAGESSPIGGGTEWDLEPLFFFVMRHVEGASLSAFRGAMPSTEAVKLLLDVSRAIEYAHTPRPPQDVTLIHRDIKPDNVILDEITRRAVVLDFGIGYVDGTTRLTRFGMVVGTGRYLAPEQFEDDNAPTVSLDIYSIGCLGYFLLTGHDPFHTYGGVGPVLHAAKLRWTKDDLVREAPDAPRDIVAVIARCMDPDPAKRYQSAAALVHALEALLPQLSIYALFAALKDGSFDTAWWEATAREVGYKPAPSDTAEYHNAPTANVFFLHVWLQTLGFRSVEAVMAEIASLRPVAAEMLGQVPQKGRLIAVGVDLIRLALGLRHRITELYPEADIREDAIAHAVRACLGRRRRR